VELLTWDIARPQDVGRAIEIVTNDDGHIVEGLRIGCDIGQRVDPSALTVVEVQRRGFTVRHSGEGQWATGGEFHFVVRQVERLPLGTLYPDVARRLADVARKVEERVGKRPKVWMDATGVGQPVVDLVEQTGIDLVPVYLTSSDRATMEGGELRLGKGPLVSRMQVLLQNERIHLPKTPEAQALVNELLTFEIRVSDNGHASFGVFKTGSHDDLAVALGLAVWENPAKAHRFGFAF
jgi:hypothetical protein